MIGCSSPSNKAITRETTAAVGRLASHSLRVPINRAGASLALLVFGGIVATAFRKPATRRYTRRMAAKTGIAVALPYQGTSRCIYLV